MNFQWPKWPFAARLFRLAWPSHSWRGLFGKSSSKRFIWNPSLASMVPSMDRVCDSNCWTKAPICDDKVLAILACCYWETNATCCSNAVTLSWIWDSIGTSAWTPLVASATLAWIFASRLFKCLQVLHSDGGCLSGLATWRRPIACITWPWICSICTWVLNAVQHCSSPLASLDLQVLAHAWSSILTHLSNNNVTVFKRMIWGTRMPHFCPTKINAARPGLHVPLPKTFAATTRRDRPGRLLFHWQLGVPDRYHVLPIFWGVHQQCATRMWQQNNSAWSGAQPLKRKVTKFLPHTSRRRSALASDWLWRLGQLQASIMQTWSKGICSTIHRIGALQNDFHSIGISFLYTSTLKMALASSPTFGGASGTLRHPFSTTFWMSTAVMIIGSWLW